MTGGERDRVRPPRRDVAVVRAALGTLEVEGGR
jgi:hypothetical protein